LLGNAAVTATDANITGDAGTFEAPPTGAVTLTTSPITGTVHVGDAAAVQAYNAFVTTYDGITLSPGDSLLTGTLAGVTLVPGSYYFDGAATLAGTLTLDGPANGVWIFKVGTGGTGALTGTGFSVVMAGGGDACNVTWWVAEAVTMTNSNFQGNILAGAAITVTGGTLNGNAWSKAGVTVTGPTTITGCEGSIENGNGNGNGNGNCDNGNGNGNYDHGKGDKDHGDKDHGDKGKGDKDHGDKGHGDKGHGDKGHGDKDHGDKGHGDKDHGDKGNGSGDCTNPSATGSNFALLGNAAVTATDASITGNAGTFEAPPTGAVTLTNTPITGTVHVGDAVAQQTYNNFVTTYDGITLSPGDSLLTGTLAGVTLAPGSYYFDGAATLAGTLTLDGPANGVWIFKIGTGGTGALTGTGFSVVMAGGAQACNVTWWVAEAVTMTDSNLQGNILAGAAITLTGGTLNGNAWSQAGVTVTGTAVTGCTGGNGNGNGNGNCDDDHGKGNDHGKYNQGVGNGPDGGDPGHSNHNHSSNDEDGGKPGKPGRKGGK
jgi:hypothetical protein